MSNMKDTRLNLRITPQFRQKIEELAEYHGLTISSYVHSLLVKAIRREAAEMEPGPGDRALDVLGPRISDGRKAMVKDHGEIFTDKIDKAA